MKKLTIINILIQRGRSNYRLQCSNSPARVLFTGQLTRRPPQRVRSGWNSRRAGTPDAFGCVDGPGRVVRRTKTVWLGPPTKELCDQAHRQKIFEQEMMQTIFFRIRGTLLIFKVFMLSWQNFEKYSQPLHIQRQPKKAREYKTGICSILIKYME